MKTQGQQDYENDVAIKPLYHDGSPRKPWDGLSEVARWSWGRNQRPIQTSDDLDLAEQRWQWERASPCERGQIVRSYYGIAPKCCMTTLFNLTDIGLRAILDGEDWKPEYVAYDRRPDNSGLDDGPYLPSHGPRKRQAPKSATETKKIRARAWQTRRSRYGLRGHR